LEKEDSFQAWLYSDWTYFSDLLITDVYYLGMFKANILQDFQTEANRMSDLF